MVARVGLGDRLRETAEAVKANQPELLQLAAKLLSLKVAQHCGEGQVFLRSLLSFLRHLEGKVGPARKHLCTRAQISSTSAAVKEEQKAEADGRVEEERRAAERDAAVRAALELRRARVEPLVERLASGMDKLELDLDTFVRSQQRELKDLRGVAASIVAQLAEE